MSDTREAMQDVARAIQTILPPATGFLLLAWDPKPGGRLDYVSNGDRDGVLATLRSMIEKLEAGKFARHIEEGSNFEMDPRMIEQPLFAWVGEDELGSGKFGLKQAFVPAGLVPLVAVDREKIATNQVVDQLRAQARQYRKTISLVRYTFERVELQLS